MTEPVPLPPAVYVVRLTRVLGLRLAVYGTALLFVALLIALGFSRTTQFHVDSGWSLMAFAGVFLGTVVMTIVLHEAAHGVFMRAFGGTPRFGVGCVGWVLPYAYAISPGVPFTLWPMTIISLAPLVLLRRRAWRAVARARRIRSRGDRLCHECLRFDRRSVDDRSDVALPSLP